KGNKFILKQRNYLLSSVLEKLGADIAHETDILGNLVRIIPGNFPFIGKGDVSRPATLHTFVPGIQAKYLPKYLNKYSVSLSQRVSADKNSGKKGAGGFTRELINSMSLHKDLPKIVALDTFLSDYGRHRYNFFY